MLWISGHGLHHPKTLVTYNRIAGKRTVLPLLFIALIVLWPMFASAANANHSTQISESSLRSALMRHYDRWEGAPYRYGGNSRYGVDCSGFVHAMFQETLGIEVPRSTELLSHAGPRVSRRHLAAGDIIIFRIPGKSLHAGIYVGNGQFIHASKTRGVMLSRLSNPYWTEVYEKSVRVIDRHI